jgi:hypothetical protein
MTHALTGMCVPVKRRVGRYVVQMKMVMQMRGELRGSPPAMRVIVSVGA